MAALLRLAWRELAGSPAAALVVLLCIAAGVAGRGAVSAAARLAEGALAAESRQALGGDLEVAGAQPPTADDLAAIAAILPTGTTGTELRSLTTMATAHGAARLVELRVVEPAFPLVGRLERTDGGAIAALHDDEPEVLVDPGLLNRLSCAVGDRLRLGRLEARIAGVLAAEPGQGLNAVALGPRVYLGSRHFAASGLGSAGARIRYARLLLLPDPIAVAPLVRRLRAALGQDPDTEPTPGGVGPPSERLAVRSALDAGRQSQRIGQRIADWLHLTALLALALAAVGVAAVMRARLHARLETLAVLRVCGASPAAAGGMFALQAILLGSAGGLLGSASGIAVVGLLAHGGLLPLAGTPPWSTTDLAGGAAIGAGAALVATLIPLTAVLRLPPLAILRGEATAAHATWSGHAILALGLAALATLAALDARSWLLGPALVATGAACWWIIAMAGRLLLPLVARLPWPAAELRLAGRNLARPGLQPAAAVAAVGMAGVLLGTLATYRAALLGELGDGRREPLPGLFAIDIQDDQRADFLAIVAETGTGPASLAPVVRARWRGRVGGDLTEGSGRDGEQRRFFRSREQNLSWRESPGDDEEVVAGRWFVGPGEASLEERFARQVGIGLGDRLRLDVQGEELELTVTSLRRVHWTSFRPNFFILVDPATLRPYTQQWIASLPSQAVAGLDRVGTALAERLPNVSAIEVGALARQILDLADRAAWVVRALAALALAAGLLAVGAVALASARARRTDAALLRALGAGRGQVVAAVAAEFALLGAVGGLLGTLLAAGTGHLLTVWWLNLATPVPWPDLAGTATALAACTCGAGLAACWRVLFVPPLTVLRDD